MARNRAWPNDDGQKFSSMLSLSSARVQQKSTFPSGSTPRNQVSRSCRNQQSTMTCRLQNGSSHDPVDPLRNLPCRPVQISSSRATQTRCRSTRAPRSCLAPQPCRCRDPAGRTRSPGEYSQLTVSLALACSSSLTGTGASIALCPPACRTAPRSPRRSPVHSNALHHNRLAWNTHHYLFRGTSIPPTPLSTQWSERSLKGRAVNEQPRC